MNENHFTSFKIENFKRFKSLELKNLGQFNLIVGDNNVGKTSLLEALLFDKDGYQFVQNLVKVLRLKDIGLLSNIDLSLLHNKETSQYTEQLSISIEPTFYKEDLSDEFNESILPFSLYFDSSGQLIWRSKYEKKELGAKGINISIANGLMYRTPYIPFGFLNEDLAIVYSTYLQGDRNKKKRIIKASQIIIPDLEDFEIQIRRDGKPEILVHRKDKNSSIPLSMFGDGTIKLFRILFEAVVFERKRLMIDEIDAGIHFSRMKGFWISILQIFKEVDIQLFATTHNLEFLKYYSEALEELKSEDLGRVISLSENFKTKEVNAFTLEFKEFNSALEIGNDIR